MCGILCDRQQLAPRTLRCVEKQVVVVVIVFIIVCEIVHAQHAITCIHIDKQAFNHVTRRKALQREYS